MEGGGVGGGIMQMEGGGVAVIRVRGHTNGRGRGGSNKGEETYRWKGEWQSSGSLRGHTDGSGRGGSHQGEG